MRFKSYISKVGGTGRQGFSLNYCNNNSELPIYRIIHYEKNTVQFTMNSALSAHKISIVVDPAGHKNASGAPVMSVLSCFGIL
jgi:Zn-finger domain-containing protein